MQMGISQKVMTVEEWCSINDNPIQRNTVLHANKAINKHLKELSPTHARVSAAMLIGSGTLYKLDGHSRAYLWKNKQLQAPTVLFVDVYSANTMKEVEDLYKQFDSKDACETTIDKLHGAFRRNNFEPESGLVISGGVHSAIMSIISLTENRKKRTIYEELPEWIETLRLIDKEKMSRTRFTTAVLSAVMLTVREDKKAALKFWTEFAKNAGVKRQDGKKDGIQLLSDLIEFKKNRCMLTGMVNIKEIITKAIICYEVYKRDGYYNSIPSNMDTTKYIQKIDNKSSIVKTNSKESGTTRELNEWVVGSKEIRELNI